MLSLSLLFCSIDTVVLPVLFLYFPCRCLKAPGVTVFPPAGFLPAPANELTLLLVSKPLLLSSWNLGHKKAVTSMLKCQDHGICPEGLSQTISTYSANTMNSLKKIINLRSFTHFWWYLFDALNTAHCSPCLCRQAAIKDCGLFLSFSIACDLQNTYRLLQS